MRGGVYEQDTKDMDGKLTGMTAKRYRDHIVGIKVAHFVGSEWTPVDEAVKAGNIANAPVMIDFGGSSPPLSIEELFTRHLRPAIFSPIVLVSCAIGNRIVDINTKKVKPFVTGGAEKRHRYSM